jgi:hypothetical protein
LLLIFELVTAPFLSLGVATAPFPRSTVLTAAFFSWIVPTLFFGRTVAATAALVSETNNAASATPIAGLGLGKRFTKPLLSVAAPKRVTSYPGYRFLPILPG